MLSALIGLVAAGVTAAAIFAACAVARGAHHPIDVELDEQLDKFENGLRLRQDGGLDFRPRPVSYMYDALRKDTAFRITDPAGRSLFSSQDGPALRALERLPPGTDVLTVQDDGLPVVLQVRERRVMRAGVEYRIQAARSTRMEEQLGDYARRLYLGSAIVSVLTALAVFAVVVYITVRRAIVPLRQASATAAGIEPRALSARLSLDGIPSEMKPLIVALNSALQRLEHGFRVQQDFLAMAAHELKTPLTLLQAEIELGKDMNRPAMLRETQLMARLVHQLLHLAEVSEGRSYRFSNHSLRALAADPIEYLARLAERDGVTLRVEHDGPDGSIEADDGAIFVMLKNLLENAIGHSPPGGTVTLEVSARGFAVVDQGRGVARADREHVFERFWHGSSASGGAGLGLAIVREICLAHRWQVSVDDAAGGGARFVVSMPDPQRREEP